MKYLIYFLLCSVCLAGDYACIFLDTTIEAQDITKVLANVKEGGSDKTDIDASQMPIWYKLTETNTTGKILSIRINGLGVNGWKNATVAQVEAQITKDVRPPSKQKIKVLGVDDFKQVYAPVESDEE